MQDSLESVCSSSVEQDALQKKLEFYLKRLRLLAKPLSAELRQRISEQLLSRLAHSLLNETVFAIVQGLMEIQHVTEAHLEQQRIGITKSQRFEKAKVVHELKETIKTANLRQEKIKELDENHTESLKQFDMTILNQLDHKVADQQCTLELAGVPGFYVTTNPVDIQAQMHLLDFILQLSVLKPE